MNVELRHGAMSARVALHGAELQSLRVGDEELMWQPRPDVWNQTSPWLFPFVGRLRGGGFEHAGRWYEMPIHGFAAANDFELLDAREDAVRLQLRANDSTRAIYPFEFRLKVGYQLNADGLAISLAVHNDGDETLPFGLGGHPGFALPGELSDWSLHFDQLETDSAWRLQPEPLPLGLRAPSPEPLAWDAPGELRLHAALFDRDALILDPVRSTSVALIHRHHGERLRVHLGGARQLGLWARAGAPYVCIEPWWGRDDDELAPTRLREKAQLLRLFCGDIYRAAWRVDCGGLMG
ncbi:aldose 1-epimerase family protein [Roseateles asaccharophilus]|uniref:Galactose mutarotase-like enzyme n=1 Tax=Roseateles asaccharophilus TaxID=582607 RepID=A0ABU2ABF1_9BURK|nr:aldose 1-epimerase family protein [Roseateles asaccharophilus]MDR7334534.1 galactose mutarotase-like enzyme [Roseateles asaccharophilus]